MNTTTRRVLSTVFLLILGSKLLAYSLTDEISLKQKKVRLSLATVERPSVSELPINQVFSVEISFDSDRSELVELIHFDATMPEHQHGMVLKPKIKRLVGNRFQVDGIKLHMRGLWRFHLQGSLGREVFDWRKDLNL
jgi:hypothetical protein